ncbi:Coenzyme F420 hydrogenase/dehydrogenase, beta subunit C-terminal domain [Mediterraneibacter glycyrrhizinilyticus]|uniref:Coenzyme F420 hydrogenase/dehydrogenase, beta subunit C-terminal domain n=1 Tax=Mediterraneibacter glycyrrhizinilyticus TaxID=342942 RepID=UPI0025A40018|nr:Coenzyme F420 hydrogenase/dehydrogenase, beta subunit C-terminal domain [Mediterraneibacter glycyrrhizinilyticus]MDM8125535.1 Coenzyme F420 hydrogenase/dehydrogenase, beta subunit C-terminal domain [Mediterraneibacter glycyrrhizinilyticus]
MVERMLCCGCHACLQVCPKNAIEWLYDEKGFGFPSVDNEKCVSCGLCERVCPMDEHKKEGNIQKPVMHGVYGAYGLNRENSTSGGIFYYLAKMIVDSGGFVAGVVLDSSMNADHICSNQLQVIEKMRGAKYVQSNMGAIYSVIEGLLREKRRVLFTGTPCQARALNLYLDSHKTCKDTLILCDLICHGVGSPHIFQEYISLCEKKSKKQIQNHYFRSKCIGWHQEKSCNEFCDGTKDYTSHESQMFLNIYIDDVTQRESCTHCPFASTTRCSDITIGDFWGIEKIKPEFDDNRGVSLVICNTEKGKQVFDTIKSDLTVMEFSMEEAIRKQPHLQKPLQYGKKYDQFWRIYQQCGFEGVARKMYQYGIQYDLIRSCKNILRPLKKKLKRNS